MHPKEGRELLRESGGKPEPGASVPAGVRMQRKPGAAGEPRGTGKWGVSGGWQGAQALMTKSGTPALRATVRSGDEKQQYRTPIRAGQLPAPEAG